MDLLLHPRLNSIFLHSEIKISNVTERIRQTELTMKLRPLILNDHGVAEHTVTRITRYAANTNRRMHLR